MSFSMSFSTKYRMCGGLPIAGESREGEGREHVERVEVGVDATNSV
jgi:hypothetical protein